MKKRGRVLRDASAGTGLLMVEGRQFPFVPEGVWKSETGPSSGLFVDVELDQNGQIAAILAVPESQLAKEQAEAVMSAAKEKGPESVSGMVARFGLSTFVAEAVLIVCWFFMAAVSLDESIIGQIQLTFWQVLGFLNSGNMLDALVAGRNTPAAGKYGLLALACLAGPFLGYFWRDKRAHFGAMLPLAFMVFVAIMVRSNVHPALGWNGNTEDMVAETQQRARNEMMQAISLGMGAYLSVLASLYVAGAGVRRFLIKKEGDSQTYASSQKSTA